MATRAKILLTFALLTVVYLVSPYEVHAAQKFRVAMVTPVKPQYAPEDALQLALTSRTSADVVRITWSEKEEDRADLIRRIREVKPDVIYTWGTVTTKAVAGTYDAPDPKLNILDTPIIFFTVAYPDQTKIIRSMEHPGRNVTGVTHVVPIAEQMATLMRWGELKKGAIGIVYNSREPNMVASVAELEKWCLARKVRLVKEPVPAAWEAEADVKNIQAAVARLSKQNIDWLYIGADKMMALTYADQLTQAALTNGIPTFSAVETPVRRHQALWGLYSPVDDAALKAAEMIVSVLNGSAQPSDIPVVVASQSIVINQDTMTALNIFPPTLLRRSANVVRSPPTDFKNTTR